MVSRMPIVKDKAPGDPRDYRTHVPEQQSPLRNALHVDDIGNAPAPISSMSLPGLGLEEPEEQLINAYGVGSQSQTQTYDLKKETEWRFEVAIGRSIIVRAHEGHPELFGTELTIGHTYTFTSTKAAIWTWSGCVFEVASDYGPLSSALTSEYIAEETPAIEHFNTHFALESLREWAIDADAEGPRILILGPDNAGKSTLAKTLTGLALRSGRGPMVVNIDPSEGVLSLPGTLTATVFKTLIEVEEGWGNAPMSGPNGEIPVKVPLVYYYGSMVPEEKDGSIYKAQVRQVALAVSGKIAQDHDVQISGIIVDTPGSLVNTRAAIGGYDLVAHVVSEFGISAILCLGSERLYSDLARKFEGIPTSRPITPGHEVEKVSVVKITKSGGIADRDATYMRAIRDAQVKGYFYGSPNSTLQPRQQQVDFDTVVVYRRINPSGSGNAMSSYSHSNNVDHEESFLPGGADDEEDTATYRPSVPLPLSQIFERLTSPLPALRNCVLAVMNCEPEPEAGNEQAVLRDSSVMGFLYVTDIDEGRGKISLLSPVAGRVPNRALVWAEAIDGILGLT